MIRRTNWKTFRSWLAAAIFASQIMTGQAGEGLVQQRLLPAGFEVLQRVSWQLPSDSTAEEEGFVDLDLIAFERRFQIRLRAVELLAPGADIVWLTGEGPITQENGDNLFLAGEIVGEDDSVVRLTSLESGLEGMIISRDGIFFLEPAARYLPSLPHGQTLAYRLDAVEGLDSLDSCGVSKSNVLNGFFGAMAGGDLDWLDLDGTDVRQAKGLGEVELRLIIDHYYFERHKEKSVDQVHALIHQVNGIFEKELGLSFRITDTLVATSRAEDPVGTATQADVLLEELARLGLQGSADVAHLITGRELQGETLGIAWMGSICNPPYAVGLTQDQVTGGARLVSTAHELAHVLGARHDGVGFCGATSEGYIMWPVLDVFSRSFSECTKRLTDLTLKSSSCVAQMSSKPLPSPELISPTGSVPGLSVGLEWDEVEGAGDYLVEIKTETDSSVYQQATTSTILIPEMDFEYGQSYSWRVTARDASKNLGDRSAWLEFNLSESRWRPRRSGSGGADVPRGTGLYPASMPSQSPLP